MSIPKRAMRSVHWAFQGGPYGSRDDLESAVTTYNRGDWSDWAPHEIVIQQPNVVLKLFRLGFFDAPQDWDQEYARIPVEASTPGGITQLDVLWAIQSYADRIAPVRIDRYFEGLTLLANPGPGGTTLYEADWGT